MLPVMCSPISIVVFSFHLVAIVIMFKVLSPSFHAHALTPFARSICSGTASMLKATIQVRTTRTSSTELPPFTFLFRSTHSQLTQPTVPVHPPVLWMAKRRVRRSCLTVAGKNQMQLMSSSCDHPGNTTDNDSEGYVTTGSTAGTFDDLSYRKILLHEKLLELDCFVDETDVSNFEYVVQQSLIDPTASILLPTQQDNNASIDDDDANNNRISGMQKYGKSAIKTCQTFYCPKSNMSTDLNTGSTKPQQQHHLTMQIAAARTARQIEFLYQRHKAQQTPWIRNHDIPSKTTMSPALPSTSGSSVMGDDSTATTHSDRTYFRFIVVLDNLRSAQNVGSIYRTADATKCQQVITIGITPNPCNGNGIHKIQKSSLGAELFVPTQHFSNATTALQYICRTYPTYRIVCVETTSESIPYTDLRFHASGSDGRSSGDKHGIVFIFGNEVTGVDVSFYLSHITKMKPSFERNAMMDADSDNSSTKEPHSLPSSIPLQQIPPTQHTTLQNELQMIEIPMYGTKNSLNVAVCVSIILYEMIRQSTNHNQS